MTEPAASASNIAGHSSAHHRLAVRGRLGGLGIDVRAELTQPWTVLFGPSGCGKSTILRAIAGLTTGLTVDLARRSPEGNWTLLDDSRHSLPPERRALAYAPQQALLFPHLTTRQNIAFGAAVRPATQIHSDLQQEAIALFGLDALASRRPHELSGGERQRVSLARALAVPDAKLMLLDEPFAGVDRALRDDLLPRLQAWLAQRRIPVLSVTHDVDEVFVLGAEVIRLREGQVLAQGTPRSVLAEEAARVLRALNPPSARKCTMLPD